jgi:hypothetical protein
MIASSQIWWCSSCECESAPSDATVGELVQRCEKCGRPGVLSWRLRQFERQPPSVQQQNPHACTQSAILSREEIADGFTKLRQSIEREIA